MEGETGGFGWLFATAGGALLLGLALAYGIAQSRKRKKAGPLEGPALRTGTHAETPTEVRQGSKEGVVRYVLSIGLALAVVAMLLVYFFVLA